MLKDDVEAMNGKSMELTTLHGLVASLDGVVPTLHDFFTRSPAAKGAEPVAVSEVSKMLRGILGQTESAVAASKDDGAPALLKAIQQTTARLKG
jgi:hypothetical protein